MNIGNNRNNFGYIPDFQGNRPAFNWDDEMPERPEGERELLEMPQVLPKR